MRRPYIGVIGAGLCDAATAELAVQVGREIARRGGLLVCGGLGGVMAAAARGAKEAGGQTIGILPGPSVEEANPYIDFPIATNMGQARNAVLIQTSHVLVAISGGYGTLSEIAMALKIGKKVVAIQPRFEIQGVDVAPDPQVAVEKAFSYLETEFSRQ